MTDFNRKPWGGTDEDGEVGYVSVTASTATPEAAREWLIGPKGSGEVLSCDESRRILPEKIDPPRRLSVTLQLDRGEGMPGPVDVGGRLRAGTASGYWEFDGLYNAYEDVPDDDWVRRMAERDAARTAGAKRRAAECRGPWWWRARLRLARAVTKLGGRLTPNDLAVIGWPEGGTYVSRDMRLPAGEDLL